MVFDGAFKYSEAGGGTFQMLQEVVVERVTIRSPRHGLVHTGGFANVRGFGVKSFLGEVIHGKFERLPPHADLIPANGHVKIPSKAVN